MQQQKLETINTLTLSAKRDHSPILDARLYQRDTAGRKTIEAFIKNVFESNYQAHIAYFYPNLLGAFTPSGQPYAAAGFQYAKDRPLFLEQYLSKPIESILPEIHSQSLERHHIVEIGNLASGKAGACVRLFQLLSLYFHNSDVRWVVFTGTRTVRAVLKRLRLEAIVLNPADVDQISDPKAWGSYYDQKPMVMAMPVAQSIDLIQSRYALNINHT